MQLDECQDRILALETEKRALLANQKKRVSKNDSGDPHHLAKHREAISLAARASVFNYPFSLHNLRRSCPDVDPRARNQYSTVDALYLARLRDVFDACQKYPELAALIGAPGGFFLRVVRVFSLYALSTFYSLPFTALLQWKHYLQDGRSKIAANMQNVARRIFRFVNWDLRGTPAILDDPEAIRLRGPDNRSFFEGALIFPADAPRDARRVFQSEELALVRLFVSTKL